MTGSGRDWPEIAGFGQKVQVFGHNFRVLATNSGIGPKLLSMEELETSGNKLKLQ